MGSGCYGKELVGEGVTIDGKVSLNSKELLNSKKSLSGEKSLQVVRGH